MAKGVAASQGYGIGQVIIIKEASLDFQRVTISDVEAEKKRLADALDVFMDLYLAAGYDKRDAAIAILKNNLYGLDIDKRAYQLTYFSLIMKARQFNRRIFSNDITLNVYQIITFKGNFWKYI